MTVHALLRLTAVAWVATLSWSAHTARADQVDVPVAQATRLRDDGERFIAFYGQLDRPLTVLQTWRVLRGLRVQLEKLAAPRRVAGILYYVGNDLHLAAVDFGANEVFIDHIGERYGFTLIWRQVEPDFQPGWSLRSPDRIESTEPGRSL